MREILLVAMVWPSVIPRLVNAQASATDDRIIKSKVDAYLKPYLDLGGFTGSILIAKSGRAVFSKGYGMANFELNVPNDPQTKVHLGSFSKTFTTATNKELQERDTINFSDPPAQSHAH